MNARLLAAGLTLLLAAAAVRADDPGGTILVTFADPAMSNAARAGPVGPGYARRTSSYLVSIDVRRAARRLESAYGLKPLDEWPIDPLKVHCVVYAVDAGTDLDALLARLRQEPRVESAQRMNTFEVLGSAPIQPSDPYAGLQHSVDELELAAAHRWSQGHGSRVAIVDTGADFEHPELESRIGEYVDFVGGDDDFGADAHGTAVAGIIGASSDNGIGIVGVAPAAALSVLKACWYVDRQSPAVCNSFTLAKALSYAIESRNHVINLSLAGPRDPLLSRLVERALANGKIVVAAAPADAARDVFPADVDGVILVDAAGRETAARPATVYAPGTDILVPVPGGGFDFSSGSSLSAAHVTGVVALLLSRQPGLTHRDVGELLAPVDGVPGRSVNACRALAVLLDEPGCRPAMSAADSAN